MRLPTQPLPENLIATFTALQAYYLKDDGIMLCLTLSTMRDAKLLSWEQCSAAQRFINDCLEEYTSLTSYVHEFAYFSGINDAIRRTYRIQWMHNLLKDTHDQTV